jgi:hypothetical protein
MDVLYGFILYTDVYFILYSLAKKHGDLGEYEWDMPWNTRPTTVTSWTQFPYWGMVINPYSQGFL